MHTSRDDQEDAVEASPAHTEKQTGVRLSEKLRQQPDQGVKDQEFSAQAARGFGRVSPPKSPLRISKQDHPFKKSLVKLRRVTRSDQSNRRSGRSALGKDDRSGDI